jgi:ascorbate PTS system EIIA or EIIAB component
VTPVLGAEVGVQATDWQEAIRASCQPLLAAGAVEERYVDRCVDIVTEQGPYIVVAPGIALAHARPEDGVSELALSVVSLAEPVGFGHPENDPVDLVFAFASPDREQHVQLLAAMARAIGSGLADSIRRSKSSHQALASLEGVLVDV